VLAFKVESAWYASIRQIFLLSLLSNPFVTHCNAKVRVFNSIEPGDLRISMRFYRIGIELPQREKKKM